MKTTSMTTAMAIMAVWLMPTLALAEPRLEGSFGSQMVLQREKPIKLKGSTKAGEEVTVEFAGQKKSAKADEKGRWTITLDPLKASKKPQTMVIKEAAGKPIELEDVLVGDVWFGSGQSNMAFSVDHCDNDVKDPQRRDKVLAEIAAGSPLKGFYFTPFKGNGDQTSPHFKKGEGVDQFGREQVTGPEPKGGAGVWEHRIIGLASYGPGIAPGHGVMFRGINKPGTYRVYIDNLRIRHVDGKTTPLWSNGKDTKTVKAQENELFKDIEVRTVDVKDVGK